MSKLKYLLPVLIIILSAVYSYHNYNEQDEGNIVAQDYSMFPFREIFPYIENGTKKQTIEYHRNVEAGESAPVLLWIHGGYWVRGSNSPPAEFIVKIAQAGKWNIASAGYRYAKDESAPWPGIIHDVKHAVKWLRVNHKKLGIDPERIIVIGSSAGGHLAGMVATSSGDAELDGPEYPGVPTDVAAAVLFFGIYDMDTFVEEKMSRVERGLCNPPNYQTPVNDLLDCPIVDNTIYNIKGCKQEDKRQASPGTYLDPSDPPAMILHGTADCSVPYKQSEELAELYKEAGVPVELVLVPEGVHSFESLNVSAKEIVDFINKNISQ